MRRTSVLLRLAAGALTLVLAGCGAPGRGNGGDRWSSHDGDMNNPALEMAASTAFDRGRSAVKPPLARELRALAPSLRGTTFVRIRILGPGDGRSRPAAEALLAMDRANSVRDYLIALGVPVVRLRSEGRPESQQLELIVTTASGPAR